jgi:hypothetical protein
LADAVRGDVARTPSEAVVAGEIEGGIVIVPPTAEIRDLEDELCSLSATGKEARRPLDGRAPDEVAEALTPGYDASHGDDDRDVCGLLEELSCRDNMRPA